MNKSELIESVAEECGIQKVVATNVLNAIVDQIIKALSKGEEVAIARLGKFVVSERAGRVGRDPRTGNPLNIPARTVPAFRAAKELKEAVNGNEEIVTG